LVLYERNSTVLRLYWLEIGLSDRTLDQLLVPLARSYRRYVVRPTSWPHWKQALTRGITGSKVLTQGITGSKPSHEASLEAKPLRKASLEASPHTRHHWKQSPYARHHWKQALTRGITGSKVLTQGITGSKPSHEAPPEAKVPKQGTTSYQWLTSERIGRRLLSRTRW
jgi:hypothetical protein